MTVALNSLNRSMGLADVYPFVLADRVIAKLEFVHQVVEGVGHGMSADDRSRRPASGYAPRPGRRERQSRLTADVSPA